MNEALFDLLYILTNTMQIIFQVGVLYILIEFLKISKGERE
tara:strand:- start:3265 stop:3387 length:123 start_codon:yes stop_codon:yes gene_type:complete